ncbi:hypothetical protein MLD38_019953 [Melastoma candidum]|uniref:Uncharacterized protein n=1 Tax=Melastoma candidum TaxID=119954 RepID=A0ACB9QBU7_9MYRT|nr:hypothetical protein MLD38_019953 [Melastoma candidum]
MPSKLKKAIGVVKDQTSISIAKVGSSTGASNLEVVVLKATSHDETPMDERYVNEILQLVASNEAFAASCAQAISKRISKTRSWTVVLKSLMLVLRIFQEGDPYFPREVLQTMKGGGKILNLTSFRDNSYSSPLDFAAYVRLFAVYLADRLDCFIKGKLQKRVPYHKRENEQAVSTITRDMQPSMLLDRITYWQRLLDQAMVTRPTGAAKENCLVQLSLYLVVQESIDLYRDISDGMALLLDSFFNLQYQSCVSAFQMCIRTSKQYEQLSSYYAFCKSLGIGRTSEYPSVQTISDELIETLREFLKDKASFATSPPSPVPPPSNPRSLNTTPTNQFESHPKSGTSDHAERLFEKASENTSLCASFDDLTVKTDDETGPSFTFSVNSFEEIDIYSEEEDSDSSNSSCSTPSLTAITETLPQGTMDETLDLTTFDWVSLDQTIQNQGTEQSSEWWEFEPAKAWEQGFRDSSLQTNPFLQEEATSGIQFGTSWDQDLDFFPAGPTFQAAPTFSVREAAAGQAASDPFETGLGGGLDQQKLMYEQQLWLQNQDKIMQRHTP